MTGDSRAIFISIVIPSPNGTDQLSEILKRLLEQVGAFEIIVVSSQNDGSDLNHIDERIKVHVCSDPLRSAKLNAGAGVASGDVLLFLWPDCQLPARALQSIERNLKLLPQMIGGNFHVKFGDDSVVARLLARFLKQWRYKGHYYGHSAIFVRRETFNALNGFKSYGILEDYDFARRMEQRGPTLYLPETVIVSRRGLRPGSLKVGLTWLAIQLLLMLGIPAHKVARLWAKSAA